VLAAVVGGNLQGTEAVYLSKKAGWEVLLIDKKPEKRN
jgi:pyrrolysine biosynthesis protein PylC